MFKSFRPALASPVTLQRLIFLFFAVMGAWILCDDWIAGLAVMVLWLSWQLLRFPDAPPVLAFAFTFHWAQIVVGMFYGALTGSEPLAMTAPRYRDMMLLGLGCVTVLTLGLAFGERLVRLRMADRPHFYGFVIPTPMLIAIYVVSVLAKNVIMPFAGDFPALWQGLIAITYIRLALLYIVIRRFIQTDRFLPAGLLIGGEVALGFTGFFAEFREPLFIAIICAIELFDGRKAKHWAAITALVVLSLGGGILWMGIRGGLRDDYEATSGGQTKGERLSYVMTLTSDWMKKGSDRKFNDFDMFIDRLWDVYYPALALDRVPRVLPHEGGAIMLNAMQHIFTPRIFFPNKPEVQSDSLQVRKYSGVHVAGPESGTTISFGYAIQSYIDFGYPVLFGPILLYGFFMGLMFRFFLKIIRNHELAVGVVTVIFWISLYQFNRSWPKQLGLSLTLMIYLGGAVIFLDRYVKLFRGTPESKPAFGSVPANDSAVSP